MSGDPLEVELKFAVRDADAIRNRSTTAPMRMSSPSLRATAVVTDSPRRYVPFLLSRSSSEALLFETEMRA